VTPPASGRSSPLQHYEPNGHRFADDLEGQNDEQLDGLSAKVKLLKDVRELQNTASTIRALRMTLFAQITIGIGNEVRESTKQLSEMVRPLLVQHFGLPIKRARTMPLRRRLVFWAGLSEE
jgi:blocked-early-in-transport protein 1